MTDIRRHLPEVLKLIEKKFKSDLSFEALEVEAKSNLRQEITELLPASYFVTSGKVSNAVGSQLSAEFDLILGDKTLAPAFVGGENQAAPVHAVLAALDFKQTYSQPELVAALAKIASLKRLRPAQVVPRDKLGGKAIPKQLFPLGLILTQAYSSANQADSEAFCQELINLLQAQPPDQRPDYLYLFGHNITYRNPVFDGAYPTAFSCGLARHPDWRKPRPCYVCKNYFTRRHFFYDQFCPACGDFSYIKRYERVDLTGKIALITGARLKIGYAVALRLLRNGAQVIATSRFPRDAARRFAAEPDFSAWQNRLHIYGLDLRHLAGLEAFMRYLKESYPRLDILINNAAQTVRRPPAFYAHLLAAEEKPLAELPAAWQALLAGENLPLAESNAYALLPLQKVRSAADLSQVPLVPGDENHNTALFPPGQYDADGQQIDKRPQNSWNMRLEEISLPEMVEVTLVNSLAPAALIAQLKPLMAKTLGLKFIINVAAVEGQFAQEKRGTHPHTNMAKAALNMLTYTSAADYAEAGIFMSSVDPGWISEQNPSETGEPKLSSETLPLDLTDAAARVCDPIFSALNNNAPAYGQLFKDFKVSPW